MDWSDTLPASGNRTVTPTMPDSSMALDSSVETGGLSTNTIVNSFATGTPPTSFLSYFSKGTVTFDPNASPLIIPMALNFTPVIMAFIAYEENDNVTPLPSIGIDGSGTVVYEVSFVYYHQSLRFVSSIDYWYPGTTFPITYYIFQQPSS